PAVVSPATCGSPPDSAAPKHKMLLERRRRRPNQFALLVLASLCRVFCCSAFGLRRGRIGAVLIGLPLVAHRFLACDRHPAQAHVRADVAGPDTPCGALLPAILRRPRGLVEP